jgi:FMN phosphatase YigB (HAD superfamily)
MQQPSAIFFDLDGTLFLSPAYARARFELGVRLCAQAERTTEDAARERLRHGLRSRSIPSIGSLLLRSGVTRAQWRDAIREHCPPASYVARDPLLHAALAAAGSSMFLGIISNNVPEIIADTLAALEVPSGLFRAIVGIDERELLKPDPYLFEQALASAAIPAERAVMAGDSLFFDLAPATRLGMQVYKVQSPGALCAWLHERAWTASPSCAN